MSKFVIACSIVLCAFVAQSSACGRYKATLRKLENCAGDDAIVKVEDGFNIELTDQCKVVVNGCVVFKAFNSGTANYKIKKSGMVLKQGTEDICTAMQSVPAAAKGLISALGAPESCPVSEGKVCATDESIDVSQFKNMMGFAKGKTELEVTVDHDNGKSCYNVVVEIHK
ncbi:hypothetical protein ACFFRR_004612 [Megaselia abdita]